MNLHRSEISRRWAAILARLKETGISSHSLSF